MKAGSSFQNHMYYNEHVDRKSSMINVGEMHQQLSEGNAREFAFDVHRLASFYLLSLW